MRFGGGARSWTGSSARCSPRWPEGSALQEQLVSAGADAGGAAQVDAADGRPAQDRLPAVAAVRLVFAVAGGAGAPDPGGQSRRVDRAGGVVGGRHRVPEGRAGVAGRGKAVLRVAREGRQRADRRGGARRHRPGVEPPGVAAVPPREVGRHLRGFQRGRGSDRGSAGAGADPGQCAAPAEVGARAGDDRRARHLGPAPAGARRGCRLRGGRPVPHRADRAGHPVRRAGEIGHQHAPRGHRLRAARLRRHRPAPCPRPRSRTCPGGRGRKGR